MNDREQNLNEIKKEVHSKMKEEEINQVLTGIYSRIISTLAHRLVKFEGYSVVGTILKREIRVLAKRDAETIMKIFGLEKSEENLSKVLKIAATIIGYNLKVEGEETVVLGCPFGKMAKEMNDPLLCNICTEYVNGVTEAVLGDGYEMVGTHDLKMDSPNCYYKLRKK